MVMPHFHLQYNFQNEQMHKQLQKEAKSLQKHLENKVGSAEQMGRQHNSRVQRISQIEKEVLLLQQPSLLSPEPVNVNTHCVHI